MAAEIQKCSFDELREEVEFMVKFLDARSAELKALSSRQTEGSFLHAYQVGFSAACELIAFRINFLLRKYNFQP